MINDATEASSSLLDALDRSYTSGQMQASPAALNTPIRNIASTFITDHFPPSEESSKRIALEAARARQRESVVPTTEGDVEASLSQLFSNSLSAPSSSAGVGGFRLHYDQETPLRSIDLGGADQEQKISEFVTRSIDNENHGLTVRSSMEKLGLRHKRDILPGLEIRLLDHQVIGVAWMLEKEKSSDRGGILADDMGLGKTVQMIGTMAMNMPTDDDDCKTTLIVVPAALLQQWKDEIDTKTNGLFTVHIHHGLDKLKKTSQVKSKDVIVTSYQTLVMDFTPPKDLEGEDEADYVSKYGGVLARTKFYRVIADEAQFIRNRSTRASISMAYVRAKYRWMLTGTPITNTLADIYGLLRFGRFRPWNDWNSFNEYVAKIQIEDAPLAGFRAQTILKPILLRRTKDAQLEGEPILKLPPKEIKLVTLKFSMEERDVYDSFEKRTKIRLNKFIRERTLVNNHAAVLVMILRMRQLCCHPHLILSQTAGYEDPTLLVAGDNEKELGRAKKSMGLRWVTDVKKRFLLRAAANELLDFADEGDEGEAACPQCKELFMNDNARVLTCGHEICFECSLELKNSPIAHNGIFGEGSDKENTAREKEYEAATAKGWRPCPTCNKMVELSPEKMFKAAAFEPTDEELTRHADERRRAKRKNQKPLRDVRMRSPSPVASLDEYTSDDSDDLPDIEHMFDDKPKKHSKNSRVMDSDDEEMGLTMEQVSAPVGNKDKGKKRPADNGSDAGFDDDHPRKKKNSCDNSPAGSKQPRGDGPSDAVLAAWGKGDDDLEPSSKMMALVGFLKEWDSTGDKTICYSQWTSMLDLIEIIFSRHGIRFLRFDGKMDRASRDRTIARFKRPGGPKVILISTKCGSVGLNLVSANRIINMDLSWNYAAESQAYDRCHRIGQDKTVHVKRLVVENTIEERMLKLQDVKVGLAEAALGEGTGAKLHKLSVKDIKYLFGMTAPEANKSGQSSQSGARVVDDGNDSDEDSY
ncbi:SNF2 family DNA-dependent ATPase [Cyathus striatus]|nr:SNF2 family DNA-dependent ATPase [Cyathus striatus]